MTSQNTMTRMPIVAIIAGASVAIVLLDAIGAFVSAQTGVPYEWFFVGSVLIFGLTGAMTYRSAGRSLGRAALAALAVGIVDVTLGWWVSWTIGPGHPSFPMTPLLVTASAAFSACIATVTGAIGALIARVVPRIAAQT